MHNFVPLKYHLWLEVVDDKSTTHIKMLGFNIWITLFLFLSSQFLSAVECNNVSSNEDQLGFNDSTVFEMKSKNKRRRKNIYFDN